jgi:hypothetical protein
MLRVIYDYLFTLISFAGAILTLILFQQKFFPLLDEQGTIGVLFLGVLTFVFLTYSMALKIIYSREAKYARALPLINEAFRRIHSLTNDELKNKGLVMAVLENCCSKISSVFTMITSTKCSVCIKVLVWEAEEVSKRPKCVTLVRDTTAISVRDYSEKIKINHWVTENTDFSYVLENIGSPIGRYFFSNFLPFFREYKNTSFGIYKAPPKNKYLGNNRIYRYFRWTLPYKSTIVAPICPSITRTRSKDNLVGFLCIDSPRLQAFKRKYDVDLLTGISDGLFRIISVVQKL